MVVNGRPLKRMKRRVTADLYDFLTFPSGESTSAGPFRTTVREFLTRHALLPPPSSLFPHLLTWQILFQVGENGPDSSSVVCLDVVEEDVARTRSVYCDQCRVVGWSGNPVCGKRYHFIIKADGNSIGGYNKSCTGCGEFLQLSDSRCKSCNHMMTTEDMEDCLYHQLDDTTHLLHGVVHANGYGHLLRVNGREGGSRLLSGCRIMDFWDRLCKTLGVRKVSVMDVSKKYGLEFRLLHGITKGHPWYGEWGYEFGAGSFALTHDAYKMAVEIISNLPLSIFISQARKPRTRLQDVLLFYQSLSERELVNIRDLFRFLMNLIHDAHKSSSKVEAFKKRLSCDSRALCAWTSDDIVRVEDAMFRVLRAVTGPTWVSWRALRGAVCKVAPPELLDFCLKELKGKQAADGMIVNARCASDSGAIEFRLEAGGAAPYSSTASSKQSLATCPSKEHLLQDLKCLYESMLHPRTMVTYIPLAKREVAIDCATKLLDCKQFAKDYKTPAGWNPPLGMQQLLCEVDLSDGDEEDDDDDAMNPPPEIIILPPNATISDLKREASKAFQEVYLILRKFQAEELVGYGDVDESTQVKLLLGSTEFVRVRGDRCMGKNSSCFRMERGVERWTVDCSCGAKDDDGERMLACDACGVWQHTRCAGIHDFESVPARFVCHRCRLLVQTGGPKCKDESPTKVVVGGASSVVAAGGEKGKIA